MSENNVSTKYRSVEETDAQIRAILELPLIFAQLMPAGAALPRIALEYHEIRINIKNK
jgi:hypothetical protein